MNEWVRARFNLNQKFPHESEGVKDYLCEIVITLCGRFITVTLVNKKAQRTIVCWAFAILGVFNYLNQWLISKQLKPLHNSALEQFHPLIQGV